ncbi:MAG TPA: PKD domain-containing protein [Methanoregula sp.]|nr:PKD domain-containing protein [Methanoregula sp.]
MKTVHPDDRAASELVGVLMLLAIFVTVIVVIGAFYLSQPVPQKVPAVSMNIANASSVVIISNTGGDSISWGKYSVWVDGVNVTDQIPGNTTDPANNWEIGDIITYTKPGGAFPSDVKVIYTSLGSSAIVLADKTLGVADSPQAGQFYTITSSLAGAGGSISPLGGVAVPSGGSQTFAISSDTTNGYFIDKIFADGSQVSVGSGTTTSSYTFTAVTGSHTINASFTKSLPQNNFAINVTAGTGGTITPGNNTYVLGANQTFTIAPLNTNYRIATVVVDGGAPNITSSLTFSNIRANHTIAATFATNLSPGIVANYYLGQNWAIPGATNIAARIHFADNAGVAIGYPSDVASWPIGYINRDDNFSVIYTGLFNVPANETYTFYLTSDDGSWLTVDGTQVIDNGGDHSATMKQASLMLTAGLHPITVKMYENGGEAVIYLEYSNSSVSRTFATQLYHYAIYPPVAGFTGTPTAGTAPLTVQFNDTSTDATAWSWDFGDGSTSTLQNPSHTYGSVGSYNVTLTAMNSNGANTIVKSNYINVVGSFLPGFVASYYRGMTWTELAGTRIDTEIRYADAAGQAIGEPSDESNWAIPMTGRDDNFSVAWDGYFLVNTADTYTFSLRSDDGSWLWVDGTQLINNGGDHSVTTVTGTIALAPGYHHIIVDFYENGGQAVARLQYSTLSNPTLQQVNAWHTPVTLSPVAAFSGAPTTGIRPLTVIFTDLSTNAPTSWSWSFGDGDATNSTVQNPVHRYANTGIYTVSLTASNAGGSNVTTKTNYINVTNPVPPVAAFTGIPTSGTRPLTVTFTDTSANSPTSWSWNFGDGNSTNATAQNPVHQFVNAGTYSVTLNATNAGGSNSSTRTNYIIVTPPAPIAGFTGSPTTGNRPLTVVFTDSSTNSPTSWSWTFGDGDTTNATVQNPVHQYANAGTYTVSLIATNAGGSNSSTRANYIVVSTPPPVAGFSGTPTTGNRPLTVIFTDSSTNSPTSWSWTFGDGDSTNATVQNPVHRYANAGTYTVSLTATNAGGSNTSTRTNYITANVPPPQVIFYDNFDAAGSPSGWSTSGTVARYTGVPHNGTADIRLRNIGQIWRTVPTTGYSTITISFSIGGTSLETGEFVGAEWSPDGLIWTSLQQIPSPGDGALHAYSFSLPSNAANNAAFAVRFRISGNAANDYGYVDDVQIMGIPN